MRRSRWWQREAKVRSRGCSNTLVKVCSVTKRGWEPSLFSRCLVVFNVMLVSNKRSRRQVLAGFHRLFSPSSFFFLGGGGDDGDPSALSDPTMSRSTLRRCGKSNLSRGHLETRHAKRSQDV